MGPQPADVLSRNHHNTNLENKQTVTQQMRSGVREMRGFILLREHALTIV
jgi:hypothetical protein